MPRAGGAECQQATCSKDESTLEHFFPQRLAITTPGRTFGADQGRSSNAADCVFTLRVVALSARVVQVAT